MQRALSVFVHIGKPYDSQTTSQLLGKAKLQM